jgi:hypothetical protein
MLNLDQQKKLLAYLLPETVPSEKKAEYEELLSAVTMFEEMKVLSTDDPWEEYDDEELEMLAEEFESTKQIVENISDRKAFIDSWKEVCRTEIAKGGDTKEAATRMLRYLEIIETGGVGPKPREVDPVAELLFKETGEYRNYQNEREALIKFAELLGERLTQFFEEFGYTDQTAKEELLQYGCAECDEETKRKCWANVGEQT